ncbi:MAG: tetratricopeptide repeat-containing sulfotransferase family protein [Aquimonas sp.]
MQNEPAAVTRRRRLAEGFERLRKGDLEGAAACRDLLLTESPADAEIRYFATEVCIAQGLLAEASEHIGHAIAAAPGQWPLVLKRARILLAQRRRDDFRRAAVEASELAGCDPFALWEVGRAYMGCDDPEAARPLFERAIGSGGDDAALHLDLATAQFFAGEFDQAERSLEVALARAPRMGEAVYLRSTLRRQRAERNHVGDLQARLQSVGGDPSARAAVLYALAKELEDLGDYEASIRALLEGAALKHAQLGYDVADEIASIDAIGSAYDADALSRLADGVEGEGAIFIVGMPRSGTTLVERMLDRVPGVRSAGELMDFKQVLGDAARHAHAANPALSMVQASMTIDFDGLGREYMRGAREAAFGAAVFIDKMPVNFLYCGLIAKALPSARILHLVRDPMDAGYAVFKTLFNQAYFFSYEQTQLADYLACYHRIMAHWHAQMPGRILDVRYESLVTDTEAEARRVLDFCGLEWRPEVLSPDANARPSTTASAAQVREPVHPRSVGRWRQVANGLEPLRARLQQHGLVDAEGGSVP